MRRPTSTPTEMARRESTDLSALREQILGTFIPLLRLAVSNRPTANIRIIFPDKNFDDKRPSIITRLTDSGVVTAMVVSGQRNDIIAKSGDATNVYDAVTKLLDVTSRGIDKLFTEGELKVKAKAKGDGEWLETPGKRHDSGRRSSGRKGGGYITLEINPSPMQAPPVALTGL